MRQWRHECHQAQRQTLGWEDLWTVASLVDMTLAAHSSDEAILLALATSDQLEVSMRHLGSFAYGFRTQDRAGASSMGISPAPGTGSRDVLPSWLIAEAEVLGRAEHSRSEIVSSEIKKRAPWDPKAKAGADTSKAKWKYTKDGGTAAGLE